MSRVHFLFADELEPVTKTLARVSLEAGVDSEEKKDRTEEGLRGSLERVSSLIVGLRAQLNPAALQKAELEKSIEELQGEIAKEKDEAQKAQLAQELRDTKRELRQLRRNPPQLTAEEKNDIKAQIQAAKEEQAELKEQLAALHRQSLPAADQSITSEYSGIAFFCSLDPLPP
jgi:DNA repair exonuclease SbcCD ATPase subunit